MPTTLMTSTKTEFDDLTAAIELFAARHSATTDVFFEVWFNYMYHRLELHLDPSKPELDYNHPVLHIDFERIQHRPLLSALFKTIDPQICRFAFDQTFTAGNNTSAPERKPQNHNTSIATMIIIFIIDRIYPDFDYRTIKSRDSDFSKVVHLTLMNTPYIIPELQDNNDNNFSHKRILNFFANNYDYCEIPIFTLKEFILSKDAEEAIARIKSNPRMWRAYDATLPDIYLHPAYPINNINDSVILVFRSFSHMKRDLQKIIDPYNLDLSKCHILEHALALKFSAGEKPNAKCRYLIKNCKLYTAIKRDFLLETGLSMEATQRMVANINVICKNAANIVRSYPVTVSLSYDFMHTHFNPGLAEFLAANPALIAEMRQQQAPDKNIEANLSFPSPKRHCAS